MQKFITVKKMIELLSSFPEELPIALQNNPMGWVNGFKIEEDVLFYYNRSKNNKMYMLFEDDHVNQIDGGKRKPRKVLKLTGYYK